MTNHLAKIGVDLHSICGTAALFVVAHWTGFMGGISATALAAYSVHRAFREWKKK